ncbi:ABC transporter family substrate-binding protein [Streptomyces sp. H27-D2]|uniref:ABC transporter family substrate-binding protein n=1 Tax=Streptomyces sp. H27-D2 TaxID=3046304 RepID=UPI002DBAF902|nr:ABC transporter family substrate-binding protein [Streptomyces sp. H27-D2]MEC4018491.1 ABC transporter family substrate-binding protein [Streptomyces sp. H27-D2]
MPIDGDTNGDTGREARTVPGAATDVRAADASAGQAARRSRGPGGPRNTATARGLRCAALLAAGALLPLPALAGCGSGGEEMVGAPVVQDIAATSRDKVRTGGTVHWAVRERPATYNVFQTDADEGTDRVAGAVLPALFTLDEHGRPQRNPDYLDAAGIVDREPKQTVVYQLNPEAAWNNGRAIGVSDFKAQWKALSGRDNGYWTARNAGYERIGKVERGANAHEVKVTFRKPYADWRSLFTPLYPKSVMGSPHRFNDRSRKKLTQSAGPFAVKSRNKKKGRVTLVRDPEWWGGRAKLDKLVLQAVPRAERDTALASGKLDLADIDPRDARRITRRDKASDDAPRANGDEAAASLKLWAVRHGGSKSARAEARAVVLKTRAKDRALRRLRALAVRKALAPGYTQLALNGSAGPLADEQVRRAVARAIDREELADLVLKPLHLPAEPLGSHLLMAGQRGYQDNSGALGGQDAQAAQAMLAEAGWRARRPSGPGAGEADAKREQKPDAQSGTDAEAGSGAGATEKAAEADRAAGAQAARDTAWRLSVEPGAQAQRAALLRQAAEYRSKKEEKKARKAAKRTAKRATRAAKKALARRTAALAAAYPATSGRGSVGAVRPAARMKDGKSLTLRFVLPSGPGSASLREVGGRISGMLDTIGVRTRIVKVSDSSYFKDHIGAGDYDLALYSWPATAYPATDARPIFAKPEPAADGSLLVEQNYTRVGTDHIDQLFDQAASELDDGASRDLVKRADARIWAAAGSVPLYQRPQLAAAKPDLVNAGAFGFATPRYQDIGYKK